MHYFHFEKQVMLFGKARRQMFTKVKYVKVGRRWRPRTDLRAHTRIYLKKK